MSPALGKGGAIEGERHRDRQSERGRMGEGEMPEVKCSGVPWVQWLEGCLIVANMRS